MIKPEEIRWGSYGTNPSNTYEGPFFPGTQKFVLPYNADERDRQIAVIAAAEGGCADSVNMYDRGIVSVGVIQWIEAGQLSVSKILHDVAETCGPDAVIGPLAQALIMTNSTFKKNSAGQWRFFFISGNVEVNKPDLSKKLFLGCSGLKGQWTPEAKVQAKTWAAGLAEIFQLPCAQRAQHNFTKSRGRSFFMADATKVLYDDTPDAGWNGAVRAAYASFAANLPSTANAMVKEAAAELTLEKWSPDWCISVIKHMTFGPKIKIYSQRYDNIRPTLEKLWNITLPKTAAELQKWSPTPVAPAPKEPEPVVPVTPVVTEPTVTVEEVEPPIELPKGLEELTGAPIEKMPDDPKGDPLGFFMWMFKLFVAIFKRKQA